MKKRLHSSYKGIWMINLLGDIEIWQSYKNYKIGKEADFYIVRDDTELFERQLVNVLGLDVESIRKLETNY